VLLLTLLITLQAIVIAYMAWDRSYGCFTRAAFNLLYPILKGLGYRFIAFDVNDFKGHNTAHGHEKVNAMVRRSIRAFTFRRFGDFMFRIYSGDEGLVATKANTALVMNRLNAAFQAEGMSITIWEYTGDLDTTMTRIIQIKKSNQV